MSEPTSLQRPDLEIGSIRDRLSNVGVKYHELSSEYALTTLRSAFVVNGGALLAMPAYVATVQKDIIGENTRLVAFSASAFICGIILTALACFCAYLNFGYHTQFHSCEARIRIIDIEESYDDVTFFQNERQRKHSREHHRDELEKYEKRIKLSLWGAVVLGFASYGAFCVGCYFSGKLLLS